MVLSNEVYKMGHFWVIFGSMDEALVGQWVIRVAYHDPLATLVMTLRHKKKGPRCHFCKKFGHIQRNCHELERKLALERGSPSSRQFKRTEHKVNSVNARDQYDSSDSEEVGLVVQDQHALSVGVNNQADVEWIVDSGATCHVCHDYSLFSELQNLEKPLDIVLGDGRTLKATGRGTVILILESGFPEEEM